jgi:nucleotide-binding universal stress UspA family protein
MFKKILVPLDGSELAASILPQVAELAKKFQSELILIHVRPGEDREGAASPEAASGDDHKTCEAYLGLLSRELPQQGLKVEVVCVTGNPVREIIRCADKQQVDLIAMATHGSGEVAWLLGSVANKVITRSSVPVMLFRVLKLEPPPLKSTVRDFI